MYQTPYPHPLPTKSPYPLRLTGPSGFFYAQAMFLQVIIAFVFGIIVGSVGIVIIALNRAINSEE